MKAPADLMMVPRMYCSFVKDGEEKNGTLNNLYFHMSAASARKKYKAFDGTELIIPDMTKPKPKQVHKNRLKILTDKK